MSKSGLFAHFGSKQELQLATIETARALFNVAGDRALRWPPRPGSSGCASSRRNFLLYVEEQRLFGRLLLRLGRHRDGYAAGTGA